MKVAGKRDNRNMQRCLECLQSFSKMLLIFSASSCEVCNISCSLEGLGICLQRHGKTLFVEKFGRHAKCCQKC